MTNADIAAAFEKIGKILNLQDANPFRVRAYERAAQIIMTLTRDIAALYRSGGTKALRDIPGIGEDLAGKIEEMVQTGKLKYLKDLEKKLPPGLLQITEIQGMGPKKTKFLYEKFKVKDIASLEKVAKSGKLTGLKGWGEKSVQNILLGIKAKKSPGIHILAGTEVDILEDGRLYLPDSVLQKLDWVVAAIHGNFNLSREVQTKRLLRAIENPWVNVIAHPTSRLLLKRDAIEYDMEAVMRAAAQRSVAMEINASIYRLDLSDVHCKRAKELGVKLCIDSDAHHPREFDYRFGLTQARRGCLDTNEKIRYNSSRTPHIFPLLLRRAQDGLRREEIPFYANPQYRHHCTRRPWQDHTC